MHQFTLPKQTKPQYYWLVEVICDIGLKRAHKISYNTKNTASKANIGNENRQLDSKGSKHQTGKREDGDEINLVTYLNIDHDPWQLTYDERLKKYKI